MKTSSASTDLNRFPDKPDPEWWPRVRLPHGAFMAPQATGTNMTEITDAELKEDHAGQYVEINYTPNDGQTVFSREWRLPDGIEFKDDPGDELADVLSGLEIITRFEDEDHEP